MHGAFHAEPSFGFPEIDAQHERMVGILERLLASKGKAWQDTQFVIALKDLCIYTCEHFQAEQKLMDVYAYPEASRHKREHDAFADALSSFIQRVVDKDTQAFGDTLEFLEAWVRRHMNSSDCELAAFIASHEKQFGRPRDLKLS